MKAVIILTFVLLGHNACQAMTMEEELEMALMGSNKDVNKRSSDTLLDEIMEKAIEKAEEEFKPTVVKRNVQSTRPMHCNYKKRSVETESKEYSKPLRVLQIATREIHKRFAHKYEASEIDKWIEQSQVFLRRNERAIKLNKRSMPCPYDEDVKCDPVADEERRRYDGKCNNIKNPYWGAKNTPYLRTLTPVYTVDLATYANDNFREVSHTKGARGLSKCIHNFTEPFIPSDPGTPLLFDCFGQFLTHDMSDALLATEKIKDQNGEEKERIVQCDQENCKGHKDCKPIDIPDDDKAFCEKECLRFVRLKGVTDLKCQAGVRHQQNGATHHIDCSTVYGCSLADKNKLVDLNNIALFKLDKIKDVTYLPLNKKDTSCQGKECSLAGDHRADMQPCLLFMHLMFARLHNIIAEGLAKTTKLNGEPLFEKTRKVVIAIYQHIVYKEFLKRLFGNDINDKLDQTKPYSGYDPSINPSIIDGYMGAAGRYGHSRIASRVPFISEDFSTVNIHFLHQTYFTSAAEYRSHPTAPWLIGMNFQPSYMTDRHVTKELSSKLFPVDGYKIDHQCNKFDLAATNIQRGYDTGLAGYPSWRKFCELSEVASITDLKGVIGEENTQRLRDCYGHDDVKQYDLFSTGLMEPRKNNALVGETFKCLLEKQYIALKFGDAHWYERPKHFNKAEQEEIRKMTMSAVICLTTGVESFPTHAFISGSTPRDCSSVAFDFTKFTPEMIYKESAASK